jgi:hypothetical protein
LGTGARRRRRIVKKVKDTKSNSISEYTDFVMRQAETEGALIKAGRAAFAKFEQEYPCHPKFESLEKLIDRHRNAVHRITGTYGSPRDDAEIDELLNELQFVREKLNKIVAMMLAEGEE